MKKNYLSLVIIIQSICLSIALHSAQQKHKRKEGTVFMPLIPTTMLLHATVLAAGETDATAAADLERVKKTYILYPENLYLSDPDGNTPLHLAARYGHVTIVDFLIQKAQEDTNTCYVYLTRKNKQELTALGLARQEADPDNNNDNYSIIAKNIKQAQCQAKEKIISLAHPDRTKGGSVVYVHFDDDDTILSSDSEDDKQEEKDVPPKQESVIFRFIKEGDLKSVKNLIENNKQKLYEHDNQGNNPLHTAVEKGDLEIVRYLLNKYCGLKVTKKSYFITTEHNVFGRKPYDLATNNMNNAKHYDNKTEYEKHKKIRYYVHHATGGIAPDNVDELGLLDDEGDSDDEKSTHNWRTTKKVSGDS